MVGNLKRHDRSLRFLIGYVISSLLIALVKFGKSTLKGRFLPNHASHYLDEWRETRVDELDG